jgi:hydrogenase maturation protease
MNKIHIICFGNLWFGDDGFGIHVYRKLAQLPLPEHVSLYDASLLGLGALNCFEGCEKAIVVDAIDFMGEAGKVHRLGIDDFADGSFDYNTTHNMGINHLLQCLPIVFENKTLPNILIYAAEIAKLSHFSDQLSQPMQNALVEIVRLIRQEIYR